MERIQHESPSWAWRSFHLPFPYAPDCLHGTYGLQGWGRTSPNVYWIKTLHLYTLRGGLPSSRGNSPWGPGSVVRHTCNRWYPLLTATVVSDRRFPMK